HQHHACSEPGPTHNRAPPAAGLLSSRDRVVSAVRRAACHATVAATHCVPLRGCPLRWRDLKQSECDPGSEWRVISSRERPMAHRPAYGSYEEYMPGHLARLE